MSSTINRRLQDPEESAGVARREPRGGERSDALALFADRTRRRAWMIGFGSCCPTR